MSRLRLATLLAVLSVLLAAPSARAQQDVKGCQDHPLVSRMPDYYISSCEADEFAAYDPTVIGGKAARWEGKKTMLGYSRKEGGRAIGPLQVVRNYEAAVAKLGGTRLGGDERRVAAEIRKGGATIGVYVECFNEGRDYTLVIVESQPMQQEVTADASVMGNELKAAGRTVVPGIYFDTGSAVIKPESGPAIDQMVKLLKGSPALKVFIVGHTDNVGTLDANLKLSSDRAASLVKALAAKGIDAARLKPAGVGPYSPVASNRDEKSRAQNRRVEMVEM
jgi:OOP family OmpA-OmpF porin